MAPAAVFSLCSRLRFLSHAVLACFVDTSGLSLLTAPMQKVSALLSCAHDIGLSQLVPRTVSLEKRLQQVPKGNAIICSRAAIEQGGVLPLQACLSLDTASTTTWRAATCQGSCRRPSTLGTCSWSAMPSSSCWVQLATNHPLLLYGISTGEQLR